RRGPRESRLRRLGALATAVAVARSLHDAAASDGGVRRRRLPRDLRRARLRLEPRGDPTPPHDGPPVSVHAAGAPARPYATRVGRGGRMITTRRILRIIARLNTGGPAIHTVLLTAGLQEGRWQSRLATGLVDPGEGDMRYFAESHHVVPIIVPGLGRSVKLSGDVRAF